MIVKIIIKEFFKAFKEVSGLVLDFIFPASCIICDADAEYLCKSCSRLIKPLKSRCCPVCGFGGSCFACTGCKGKTALDGLISAADYEENRVLQKCIHQIKYNFIEPLALPVAEIMAGAIESAVLDARVDYCLTPVPLHKKRYKWRGFNQAEILANEIGRISGMPVFNLLERISYKKPQMELSREERLKNVEDAFRVIESARITPKILLVDDVATTLSTLNECAAALKAAGAEIVIGLVAARAK